MQTRPSQWLRLLEWLLLVGLAGGLIVGLLLLRPLTDSVGLIALVVIWIFLGIPACCGLKR